MRLSEIFIAGVFVTYLILLVTQSLYFGNLYAPNATSNYTQYGNNLSTYDMTNETNTFRTRIEELAAMDAGADWWTQITAALGMSVFFALEGIKAIFMTTIRLPFAILEVLTVTVAAIDFPILGMVMPMLVPAFITLVGLLLLVQLIRLWKPDI